MGGAVVPLITTGLGLGASILGANKQKKAVERAAREQAAAARAAQATIAPFAEAGTQATQQIQEGLSTGTLGGSFTPPDLTSDPGYQFRLQQGEEALDRLQSSRGNLYSGQALKESQRFAQGLADQTFQDAFERYMREQQERRALLEGQRSAGLSAATGISGIQSDLGQQQAAATLARQQAGAQGFGSALGYGLQGMGNNFGLSPSPASGMTGVYDPNLPWKTSGITSY